MKKLFLTTILILILLPNIVSAKQLWEFGSFKERKLKWQEISKEKYQGNYQQNIKLLNYYQSLGRAASSQSAMSMLGDITMNSKNIYDIGNASTTNLWVKNGDFRLYNGSNKYGQLAASSTASTDNIFYLPGNAGANGEVLTSNGSDDLIWRTASIINTYTASTTIAALQPVYLATSTQALLISDANATSTFATKFIGFALEAGTNGSSILVQTAGIVSGFTGLTAGAEYFVSNTAGSIATTMGQYPIMVGQAISATQILIDKQKRAGNPMSEWFLADTTYYAYSDGFATGWTSGAGTGHSASCTVNGVTAASGGGGSYPASTNVFVSCYVQKGFNWSISESGTSETVVFQPIN